MKLDDFIIQGFRTNVLNLCYIHNISVDMSSGLLLNDKNIALLIEKYDFYNNNQTLSLSK